ncbi:AI-2E family transporter [Chondromyces crocatus]|uniref:Permease n=1 Tax=Chondromyces crocatus TaxID=52 RepID=A0A0K1EJQ8_CHOCO|nr:AI-2E family transporter [Chondromyces crocatus]AKT41096.1 uncharacterized protein CMC5_052550 [Chondromyces crocatus]
MRTRPSVLLRHPIAVAFAIILLFGLLRVTVDIAHFLLLGFFSILLATVLLYPIDLLSRRMPRGVAVLITAVSIVGAIVGTIVFVTPRLLAQARQLGEQLPQAANRLHDLWLRLLHSAPLAQVPEAQKLATTLPERVGEGVHWLAAHLVPAAVNLVSALSTLVLLFVLALFLAHQPATYHKGLRALVPRDHEPVVDEAWRRFGRALRGWMGGILVSMTLMGTLTALGLLAVGVESWLILGVLTFFGTFVPYAGALITAIPGLAVGLAESPERFAYVALVYLGVHIVEGYLVEPMVMKRAVSIEPAVLLFWQITMSAVFGVMGIVVATPLLVCVQVAIGYFYIERVLHKESGEATPSDGPRKHARPAPSTPPPAASTPPPAP